MNRKKRALSEEFAEKEDKVEGYGSINSDMHDLSVEPSIYKAKEKRLTNEKWTRLIDVRTCKALMISFQNIQDDLDMMKANPLPEPKGRRMSWALEFDPEKFQRENEDGDYSQFNMNEEDLEKFAAIISDLRCNIREEALRFLTVDSNTIQGLEEKLKKLSRYVDKGHQRTGVMQRG